MSDLLLTPEFRAAFISVFKPSKPKGAPADQAPKFSVRACFPPDADLSTLKKAAEKCANDWPWEGGKVPKNLRSPFRKNSELDDSISGIGDDWTVMTFNANADKRPGIVDAKVQDIIDEVDVYSGAWYRVQVDVFGYEKSGNKGVTFGLKNVQKLREQGKDEAALGKGGGGRVRASDAFTPVETTGEAKSAGGLFD